MSNVARPAIVEDKHLDYLDSLRKSGATNMFGAGPWLRNAFNLNEEEAHTVLGYWMETFPRAKRQKS